MKQYKDDVKTATGKRDKLRLEKEELEKELNTLT